MINDTPFEFDRTFQQRRMLHVLEHGLTEIQRRTIEEHYFAGKPISQIARERGVNRATVWRCLRRAEERMRRYLAY